MKVLFITFSTFAFGVRSMASYVSSLGHEVGVVFDKQFPYEQMMKPYDRSTLDSIADVSKRYDIIAISFLTNYYLKALQLANMLRKNCGKIVITGNVHATARPHECLQFSDYACVGEGEYALGELLQAMDEHKNTDNVPGIWTNKNDQIINNGVSRMVEDLDALPFPDYGLQGKYFILDKKVSDLTEIHLKDHFFYKFYAHSHSLFVIFSRGCPLSCSYCQNSLLKGLYNGKKYLRRNSNDYIISFLKDIVAEYPFIDHITFEDDSFSYCKEEVLVEFVEKYKKEIGLPFRIYSDPITFSENKLDILMEGGLNHLVVGIQSGSEVLNKQVFNRNVKISQYYNIINVLKKRRHKLYPTTFDFILNNPYSNLKCEYETLKLFSRLPRPNNADPYFLIPFPGTEINNRMKKDGLIKNEVEEIYNKSYRRKSVTYSYLMIKYLKYLPENFIGDIALKTLCSKPLYYVCEIVLKVKLVNRLTYYIDSAIYGMIRYVYILMRSMRNLLNLVLETK